MKKYLFLWGVGLIGFIILVGKDMNIYLFLIGVFFISLGVLCVWGIIETGKGHGPVNDIVNDIHEIRKILDEKRHQNSDNDGG